MQATQEGFTIRFEAYTFIGVGLSSLVGKNVIQPQISFNEKIHSYRSNNDGRSTYIDDDDSQCHFEQSVILTSNHN